MKRKGGYVRQKSNIEKEKWRKKQKEKQWIRSIMKKKSKKQKKERI